MRIITRSVGTSTKIRGWQRGAKYGPVSEETAGQVVSINSAVRVVGSNSGGASSGIVSVDIRICEVSEASRETENLIVAEWMLITQLRYLLFQI